MKRTILLTCLILNVSIVLHAQSVNTKTSSSGEQMTKTVSKNQEVKSLFCCNPVVIGKWLEPRNCWATESKPLLDISTPRDNTLWGVIITRLEKNPTYGLDGVLSLSLDLSKKLDKGYMSFVVTFPGSNGRKIPVALKSTSDKIEIHVRDMERMHAVTNANIVISSCNTNATYNTDTSGSVSVDRPDKKDMQELTVSAKGYKTLKLPFNAFAESVNIVMEKETVKKPAPEFITMKAFPVPLKAGERLTLEVSLVKDAELGFAIYATDGRQLLKERHPVKKGLNRLSFQTGKTWSPGIYVIAVNDASGKRIAQQKLVIQ